MITRLLSTVTCRESGPDGPYGRRSLNCSARRSVDAAGMEYDPRKRKAVAALVLALVSSGCTSRTALEPSHATSTTIQPDASTDSTGGTGVTTEEGFLLPPGYDADDLTAPQAPLVTVFDDRTVCDPAADDLDVLRMQALVAAYNSKDMTGLHEVMDPQEIYDATAIPHLGTAYPDNVAEWAQAGWAVNDRLRLVEVQTYAGAGADGRIERSNDLLAEAGIGWLSYTFKVQASECAVTRFVGYRPGVDECGWYTAFTDQLRAAELVDQARSTQVLVPDECSPFVLELAKGDVDESFQFNTPDPSTHYFDVEISMPMDTQLEITFLTADGVTLRIFDQEKAEGFCAEEDGQLHCLLNYPILEARLSGLWTAQVHKLSTEAAKVTIQVKWMELEHSAHSIP